MAVFTNFNVLPVICSLDSKIMSICREERTQFVVQKLKKVGFGGTILSSENSGVHEASVNPCEARQYSQYSMFSDCVIVS